MESIFTSDTGKGWDHKRFIVASRRNRSWVVMAKYETPVSMQHRVKANQIGSCSIDDWVADCNVIWPMDADRPVFDVYYRVILHGSKLGESLRRELYDETVHELGRMTIWLLSLVSKLRKVDKGIDAVARLTTPLSEMIWNKYPNCCPVCFEHRYIGKKEKWQGEAVKCDCMARPKDAENRGQRTEPETEKANMAALRAYAREHKPTDGSKHGMDALEGMFGTIYSANISVTSIESIGFHLLEEVGEIAEALANLYTYRAENEINPQTVDERKLDLENEIADTFSWIFSLSKKLQDVFALADRTYEKLEELRKPTGGPVSSKVEVKFGEFFTLSKMIWYLAKYGNAEVGMFGCRDCRSTVCKCPIFLMYNENLVLKHFGDRSGDLSK